MSVTTEQRRLVFERMVGKVVAKKYTISGLLGFGGMGAVYEALQSPMERKVALKLIPTIDPTATIRFEREATTVSKLSHPNTVTVFDFGQTEDGHLYIAMEHLVGHTLTDLVRGQGPMAPERAVHITTQICRALGEAHRIGIMHRDIKPDNIFLINVDKDPDYVKVLDFGIAKAIHGEDSADLTADGRIIGTPRYMSPEQILATPIDHRADIYSLGCILFEMICGAPPFGGNNTAALMMSHAQQAPPSFAERLNNEQLSRLPAGLESVVQRSMAKNPSHRPQTTDALRKELEQALRINQAYTGSYDVTNDMGRSTPPPASTTFEAAAYNPTGSFEHHTGDFSHQTGNFAHQQAVAHAAQGYPQNTGAFTGESVAPKPHSSTRAPLIAIGLLFLICGGAFVAYVATRPPEQPQQPNTPAVAIKTPPLQKTEPVQAQGSETIAQKAVKFRIRSTPKEADIFDGSRFVGSTPYTISLPTDEPAHTYTIKLKRYKHAEIVLDPSKPDENFLDISLIPKTSKRTKAKVRVRKSASEVKTTPNNQGSSKPENGSKAKDPVVVTEPVKVIEPKPEPKKPEPKKPEIKFERLDDDDDGLR